jgi:protein dithiol oxidoreductase (disulfide-forming)
MQRREFSLSAIALAAAVGGSAIAPAARAQAKAFQEGTDYLALDKAVPTEVPAGQIEVIEFFWYSCPHCNAFEPQFEAWTKAVPKDVTVRRVPVSFRPDFEPQQRLYYSLEAMGKTAELHRKVFDTIHKERLALANTEQITSWIEKQGVDKAKFVEMYNSFSVSTKVRKANQLQDLYKIDGVPSLGVAGRYFTSGTIAQNMGRALQVVDSLIAQSRKSK